LQRETGSTFYSSSSAGKTGLGRKLLLVEDSEPQIIQLTDILREEGFIIKVARNGREALETLKYFIPDAIILDLQMPDIDGFEVLKEIRNLKETKSIPVLILTAKHITKSELSFLKENHIYQLIQKGSLNRNDLLAYVKNLMIPKLNENKQLHAPLKSRKKTSGKAKILVIEDNPDNLITFRAILEDNYAISSANDGKEGLDMAVTIRPDLILLDISLPVLDGFKVLDEIKKNEELKGIPVVALTARAMKGDREDLLSHGFDGYIAKPIDGETFEKTIQEFITPFPTFPQGGRSRS
jgi:CheY-like chemotaxis protein